MWQLKKQLIPRSFDPPMAKRDRNGNLATSATKLKVLYEETYINRLSQNEIEQRYKKLHEWKDLLCNRRLKYARFIKTKEWTKKNK